MRRSLTCLAVGVCALLSVARGASAQPAPQVNQNCTVSVLNRTVTANADGTWILPNVPANFGPVRARVTCVVNGQTISGESDAFTVPANGAVNIPQVRFGQTTPIPTALTMATPSGPLTEAGGTLQLVVTARYSDASTRDVTPAAAGTTYTVSNPAIATVSGDGVVQAVSSGTVIVQASHEGASGMTSVRVALGGGSDADGDGIPDADEIELGLNPNNPVDAMEDFDRDNLTNLQEYQLGTGLRTADTDGDGLKDGDEVARGTNPLLRDTDGDGISDGLEVQTSSNPLDPASYNLSGALSSIAIAPSVFTLTFNTIAGDVSVALRVTGTLRDGTSIDLTSPQRGTGYASNSLTVCNFGTEPGRVFAGQSGGCTITATVAGFTANATGTVTTFAPIPRSSVALGGPGNGVDVGGDHVYVAVGAAGLQVVDVSDRSAPQVVATLSLLGSANDVKLDGDRAYVAAGAAGLHIVDVSNPLVPRLLGSVDTPGNALDVRAAGNLAFVADGAAGLQVVDVTDPAVPRIAGSVALGAAATGVDVEGTLAVVTVGAAGVRVVNVANPASPFVAGTLDTPGEARDVVVNGGFAYVADYTGSLRAIDIRNPALPLLAGTTTQALGGILLDVARMDTFVFGADIFFVNGVSIVDVNDANNLRPRAILNFPGDATGLGIAVDGSFIYLGTDTNRLYVGQYRIREDRHGIPPTVTMVSPTDGTTFVEGETITVKVAAADDLAVAAVSLFVNGAAAGIDTTAPYQFNVTAPTGGSGTLVLGATAADLGNNTGIAESVVVNVIPDPLTTAEGRAVTASGVPISGATVTCVATSGLTSGSGSFSLAGLSTVQPLITCTARFVETDGTILGGVSAPRPAVRDGVTVIGDIVIAPVPVVTAIVPKVIDASRPPATLAITGSNLSGATFAFAPDLGAITVGAAQIEPTGTGATLPIMVAPGTRGRFTLVGTNAFGAGDTTASDGNVLTLINAADDADGDGDGFPDGLELLFGSDPSLAASVPDFRRSGDLFSRGVSVVNTMFPSASEKSSVQFFSVRNTTFPLTVERSSTQQFSLLNTTFPSTVERSFTQRFSLLNTTFSSTVEGSSTQQFSLLNTTFPSTVERSSIQWFSVLNAFQTPQAQVLVSPAVSVQNLTPQEAAAQQALAAAAQQASQLGGGGPLGISLNGVGTARRLIAGQTVVVGANVSGGDGTGTVSFSVNSATLATDSTPPYAMTFTVPWGVSELTFAGVVREVNGSTANATPLTVGVDPDPGAPVSGRIVDAQGNPVVNARVELVSEGLHAELFDAGAALDALPDLTGATPARSTRVTAINTRGPLGLFGPDPLGTGLAPDYAVRFTGWLWVETAGSHTFFLGADEGARLKVNGATVVDMPGPAPGGFQESSGAIDLPAGLVPIEITFYESARNTELQLSFTPPGGERQVVPPSALVAVGAPFIAATDSAGRFTLQGVPTALGNVGVRVTSPDDNVVVTAPVAVPLSVDGVDVGDVVLPLTP